MALKSGVKKCKTRK